MMSVEDILVFFCVVVSGVWGVWWYFVYVIGMEGMVVIELVGGELVVVCGVMQGDGLYGVFRIIGYEVVVWFQQWVDEVFVEVQQGNEQV